jgi:hypothetical protein
MTPAETPDITASISARRLSSWALAVTSAMVCSCSRSVIPLNAVAKRADLVLRLRHRHARRQIALGDAPRGATSWLIGRTSRSATASADPSQSDDQQRDAEQRDIELELERARPRLQRRNIRG